MSRMRRIVLCVVVGSLLAVPYLVLAQSEGEAPSKTPAEGRRSPLPSLFGKIAVNDQQREQLYRIQDEYAAKIDALQQQIKALLAERDAKMEGVLTPGQKLRLAELREEARQRAAKQKEAGSGDATDPPTKSPPAQP
jgi:type II secretory pathway component HofQ